MTDADLVLGRLDPGYFLGGEMALDPDRVRRAFGETISPRIGVDVESAALGVQRIVDETMAAATRMHLAEKGKDPRKYTLIAFGGAGPVHAHNLARLLKVGKVVVPLGAGVASALGFLVAPPATDMVTSYVTRLERADWRHITALFAEMRDRGCALLTEAGADPARIATGPAPRCAMSGRASKFRCRCRGWSLSADDLPRIRAAFFDSYRLRFGRIMEEAPIEVLSWRLGCVAPGLDIRLGGAAPADGADAEAARRGSRNVLFETHGWQRMRGL